MAHNDGPYWIFGEGEMIAYRVESDYYDAVISAIWLAKRHKKPCVVVNNDNPGKIIYRTR